MKPATLSPRAIVMIMVALPCFWGWSLWEGAQRSQFDAKQPPFDYAAIFESPPFPDVVVSNYGRVQNSRFWFEFKTEKPVSLRGAKDFQSINSTSEHVQSWMYQDRPWIANTLWRAEIRGQSLRPDRGELFVFSDDSKRRFYIFGYYPSINTNQL